MKRSFVKIVCLFTLLAFYLGCDSKVGRIQSDLEKLMGLSVVFPWDSLQYHYNKRDSFFVPNRLSQLNLLVYRDSSSCSPCELQELYHWYPFFSWTKEAQGKFKLYFLFSPKQDDKEEFLRTLKNLQIQHPIILDTLGIFVRHNPRLSSDETSFNTFLLDDQGAIKLVGNPLYNEEIKKIIKEMIEDL